MSERPDLEAAEAEAFEDEIARARIDSVEVVAERFDLPVQWAQLHVGVHRCVDDRLYRVSCLVNDPSCERVAKSYMERRGEMAGG